MYSNREQLFEIAILFHNIAVFTVFLINHAEYETSLKETFIKSYRPQTFE